MPVGSPERRPPLVAGAVLLAGALIALSIAITFRWEIVPNSRISAVMRLDRWTGEMAWCFSTTGTASEKIECGRLDN